jgi:transposase
MNITSKFFIGIDVSKPYFDASLITVFNHAKHGLVTARFDNTPEGIKGFDKWLSKNKVALADTLLVIENTGIYHRLLWSYCTAKQLPLHIGNAAYIKWSFGIARGKNDKIDSLRLCNYAFKEADTLKATAPLDPVLLQLKDLMTARGKLLSQINSTKTYLKELKNVSDKAVIEILQKAHKQAIDGMAASFKLLEKAIKKLVQDNKAIQKNYDLLITVPGIGHLTSVYIICCTNNFAGKINGKQLACYAGVVPFEHSSGISIKGRNKVHPMANKELKKMLHLCAMTAIQHSPEFKDYYERKKAEGKNGMSVLNAIRNKIVLRAVAVVNNQRKYLPNYQKVA